MLANLATAGEAVLVEEFDGGAKEESPLGFAPRRHLGYRFDQPSPQFGDLVEGAPHNRHYASSDTVPLCDLYRASRPITEGGRGCWHGLTATHHVSRRLTSLGPQPPHKIRDINRFPWSEGFDRIFHNERVTGTNPVSSTKPPGQSRF